MLKRIHIKGYKSLRDVEVELKPLTVLVGPNAAGKSNFLDALQLLSRIASSHTLNEAFAPPYRGKPLESFSFYSKGLKGLRKRQSVSFSIEVDFTLSDFVVEGVNRQIKRIKRSLEKDSKKPSGAVAGKISAEDEDDKNLVKPCVLRYRIKIEMLPSAGFLRVADEYLAAVNDEGKPVDDESKFLWCVNKKGGRDYQQLVWLKEGDNEFVSLERPSPGQSALSQSLYAPLYPYLTAARHEITSWKCFYFEPREFMRIPNPVRQVRNIGPMGEDLPAYMNTLKAEDKSQFKTIERNLKHLLPQIDGIDVYVNDHGEIELSLKEDGVLISDRVLSEGTLRMLGLLALGGSKEPLSLVGLEEPEDGIHPRRIELVAELLKTRANLVGRTQYIVATHSPVLVDWMPKESLFIVARGDKGTEIDPFNAFGPLGDRLKDGMTAVDVALTDEEELDFEPLSVSERILRGDFDG
ncbi:MAG: AAA family ATPase [Gammaproteobacteria bacterium AqS3]|nr:AAA family ATPase [Gammaproteobacteria bacterium AqS3]